jgi:FkbM family methyltransferase
MVRRKQEKENKLMKMKVKSWVTQLVQPKIVEIEGVKIKVPQIASDAIRDAIYKGLYEPMELKLVKSKLSNDDVVMEVGTGLGLLSAYSAKKIGSQKVFTFEANPMLEKPIRDNYALNQVAPNLEMCLVGKESGFTTFYVGDHFWSSSIFNKPQGAQPITVPVVSFNEKVRDINPTFLFLDIEGGEYEFVQYADFHNVKKLLIEIHGWVLSSEQIQFVNDRLIQQGFRLVEASGKEEFYFER